MRSFLLSCIFVMLVVSSYGMEWGREGEALQFQTAGKTYQFIPGSYSGIKLPNGFNLYTHIVSKSGEDRQHRIANQATEVEELFRNNDSICVRAIYPINQLRRKETVLQPTPYRAVYVFRLWRDIPGISVAVRVDNPNKEDWEIQVMWIGGNLTAEGVGTGYSANPPKIGVVQSDPVSKNINFPGGEYLFLDLKDGRKVSVIGRSARHRYLPYLHLHRGFQVLAGEKASPDFELFFSDTADSYEHLGKIATALDVMRSVAFPGDAWFGPFAAQELGNSIERPSWVSFQKKSGFLSVRSIMREPAPEKLKAQFLAAGDPIWQDDCAELFFTAKRKGEGTVHIMSNSVQNTGVIFDRMRQPNNYREEDIRCKAKVGDRSWEVEWEIADHLFDQELLNKESTIRIHVNREAHAAKEYSGWPSAEFGKPDKFARLILSSWPQYLKQQQEICKRLALQVSEKAQSFAGLLTQAIPTSGNRFEEALFDHALGQCREQLDFAILIKEAESLIEKTYRQKSNKPLAENEKRLQELIAELGARAVDEDMKRDFHALRCAYLREVVGEQTFVVWQKNPWEYLKSDDFPSLGALSSTEISLDTGIGEFETAAVAVTNFNQAPVVVTAAVVENQANIPLLVRYGLSAINIAGKEVNDALPLLAKGVAVAPESSCELWFTINTAGLKAGIYPLKLHIAAEQGQPIPVTLVVNVHNVKMEHDQEFLPQFFTPSGMLPRLGEETAAAIRNDMAEHYALSLNAGGIPKPLFSAEGKNLTDYKSYNQRAVLQNTQPGNTFFHYWHYYPTNIAKLRPDMEGYFGAEYLSEPFKQKFAQWLNDWWQSIVDLGLSDRYYMFVCDETTHPDAVALLRLIKEVAPKVKTYMTLTNTSSVTDIVNVAPFLDAAGPHFYSWRKQQQVWEAFHRHAVRIVPYFNVHACAQQNEPYTVYRRMAWLSRSVGGVGCGTWVHYYQTTLQWNPPSMNMIYVKNTNFKDSLIGSPEKLAENEFVIPSKRWEAFREGVEDYFYLRMLEKKAKANPGKALSKEALALIDEAVAAVCDDFNVASDIAAKYKKEMLAMLLRFAQE